MIRRKPDITHKETAGSCAVRGMDRREKEKTQDCCLLSFRTGFCGNDLKTVLRLKTEC